MIQRTFAAQQRIIDQGLEDVVIKIRAIPSLPQAHHSLLKELEDNEGDNSNIARLVGDDPGLSIKVLQLANTGLFGSGHLISDMMEAVNALGTEIITSIVLSQSVFQHYEAMRHGEMDPARIWAHCWETACIAQYVSRDKVLSREDGEAAFLAGLLHEVGRFVLIENFPDKFQAACDRARKTKTTLSQCLREDVKATAAEISGYVLELWNLPAPVIEAIYFHETPEKAAGPGFTITSALHVANCLASKKYPPDGFSNAGWNKIYLESVGCAHDLKDWEKLDSTPARITTGKFVWHSRKEVSVRSLCSARAAAPPEWLTSRCKSPHARPGPRSRSRKQAGFDGAQ